MAPPRPPCARLALRAPQTPAGRVVSETSWQAVLGVELSPPETTDVLLVNPLGLYVTEINWTKTL